MTGIKFLIDADYENVIFKQHAPKNVYNLESFDGIFKATKSDLTLWKSRCVYIGTLNLKFWIIGMQYKKNNSECSCRICRMHIIDLRISFVNFSSVQSKTTVLYVVHCTKGNQLSTL